MTFVCVLSGFFCLSVWIKGWNLELSKEEANGFDLI